MGTDFQKAELTRVNFSGADLKGADFRGAVLTQADFSGAILDKALFDGATLIKANFQGAQAQNSSFLNGNLESADFSCARLQGAKFDDATLDGARLEKAQLSRAAMSRASLVRTIFLDAKAEFLNLSAAILTDASFTRADLSGSNLQRTSGHAAEFSGAILQGANFISSTLEAVNLFYADLRGAQFSHAQLESARFLSATLIDADFTSANLSRSDFEGASFSSGTKMYRANVLDCQIEHHSLEMMDNYGGLTVGDRMGMSISDGLATLRSHYSGFWQWIHLMALGVFLFPYLWFVVSKFHYASEPPTGAGGVSLWAGLGRDIASGGRVHDHLDFHPEFALFVFATLYNLLRAVLLWKTKQLELRQDASGLRTKFSLSEKWMVLGFIPISWSTLLVAAKWGFWLNLLVVLAHTYLRLQWWYVPA